MANPTLLDMPIARDGNKNTIPATDNGTTGLLSQQYGWQLINAIPPQQGGKAVKREDFNGALYLLSNLLFYLQKGWQFEWDANQNYYAGCIVKDPNNGKMYQRLNDGTSNTAPHSDTTNWKLWDLSMLANYLPLSGGALTGQTVNRNVNNSRISIYGGPAFDSGHVTMNGGARTTDAGAVEMVGSTGTDSWAAIGIYPEGTIRFGIQSSSLALCDLGGSAIVAKSLGANGYVKRVSGEIVQWGEATVTTSGTTFVNLNISFTTANYVAIANRNDQNNDYTAANAWPVSVGQIKIVTSNAGAIKWLAIGY